MTKKGKPNQHLFDVLRSAQAVGFLPATPCGFSTSAGHRRRYLVTLKILTKLAFLVNTTEADFCRFCCFLF